MVKLGSAGMLPGVLARPGRFGKDVGATLWLLGPMLLVLAPHALRLPMWISLSWLAFALLGLVAARTGRQPVGRHLKTLLALAGVAGVLLQYGTVIGPSGGVALLAFLSGAKLLETNGTRDRLGLLFIGCFLLVAQFLEGQSLFTAAYMTGAALTLVAGMIATQRPAPPWRPTFALAARLMAQALPLALLVFLLFPRLGGPLWHLPQPVATHSGLSERMSPGDISVLILSDELAFRAEFDGPVPPAPQRYWRGPVLWDYDGHTWHTDPAPRADRLEATGLGQPLRYNLTLEPNQQRWLPLLGLPTHLPELPGNPTRLGVDLQWQAREPITRRLRYEVEAYAEYRLENRSGDGSPTPALRERALALPMGGNPRSREIARAWRETAANDAAIVALALTLFRTQAFFYTLTPPRLGAWAVDDFLFESRRGFCEHYASTFVFLMRAAGVPARVVTGYQGGELNPLGNYFIVRGRDAHAWAEVWLDGQGWVRVDPTGAVAPSRVERGVEAALPPGEQPGGEFAAAWLRPLHLGWDLVNNRWNLWVLGYNQERQHQFLARLSPLMARWQGMAWALGLGATVLLLVVCVAILPRTARHDPASREYLRFCRTLAHRGIARGAAEAPEDYARRATGWLPDLGRDIQYITRLYLTCRYGPGGEDDLSALRRAITGFPPRLRRRNPTQPL